MDSEKKWTGQKVADSLHFTVDAALLFELGEQLVARRSIALAELIKNAYDADAEHVVVGFNNVLAPGGTIHVKDDGMGMTLDTITRNWMRIATNNKVSDPVSPSGRYRTGAKGVGRFAARKLARKLNIKSVAKLANSMWEVVSVEVDWDVFTPGKDIDEVGCSYTVYHTADPLPTGVELILTSVRDAWTAGDVAAVRRDLQDLTPPFPTDIAESELAHTISWSHPFSVRLSAPEFPAFEGDLSEQFYSAAAAKLTGFVRADGSALYRLKFRGVQQEVTFTPDERFPTLVGAAFLVHYFVYTQEHLEGTGVGLREAQSIGRKFGGVRIYQERFRVFPYGDPGDDWLNLDEDRAGRLTGIDPVLKGLIPDGAASDEQRLRPMLSLPGNNRLFGGVFISRALHPELNPNISRERLFENESFSQLKRFVRLGINWMTIQRVRYEQEREAWERQARHRKAQDRERKGQDREPDVHDQSAVRRDASRDDLDSAASLPVTSAKRESATEIVRQTALNIKDRLGDFATPEQAEEIVYALNKLTEVVEVQEAEQISKLAMLRILASAGTSVLIFNHQIRAVIDGLRRLTYDLGDVGSPPNLVFALDLDATREGLRMWLKIVEAQATQLGLLLGSDSRRRRRNLVVRPIVQQLIGTLELYCSDHGIEVRNSVPPYVRTPPLYEAELHSLLLNLMTNALKAVKEQPRRTIEVVASDTDRRFCLAVKDTGYGLPLEQRERVFDPFVTSSSPDPVLGVGTGLGLAIVKDIVIEHSGSVQFIDAPQPWRTQVELVIPFGVDE